MIKDVRERVRAILTELGIEFFERHEAIEAVWLCLLSSQHGYLLGPSGTGKSALLKSVGQHITGAKYWHIQMDRMLDKSDSFGQFDIGRFEVDKVWERDYSDTFGDCHIALLDEIDKAGPASTVPYLEMLEDRRFKPGKQWVQAPLISAFAAANSTLDGQDSSLKAMADRFLVRVKVDYLAGEQTFLDLLSSVVTPRTPAVPTTISLGELRQVIDVEVPAVDLPLSVASTIHRLRAELAAQGITCSDRRWKASVRVLQARAWLSGRDAVCVDDLSALRFVLWSREEEIERVTEAAWSLASPYEQALRAARAELDDLVSATVLGRGEPVEQRAAFAGRAVHQMNTLGRTLTLLRSQVEADGGEPTPVLEVQDRLVAARLQIMRECMGGAA